MFAIIFFIVLGVALLFVFANRQSNPEKAKVSIMVIAGLAVVGAIAQIFINTGGDGGTDGRLDGNVNAAIGQVTAAKFSESIPSGAGIVVISNVIGEYVSPAVQQRHDAFVQEAELNGLTVLGTISPFGPNPRPEDMGAAGMGVPIAAVRRAFEQYPSARAIVSLEGLPMAPSMGAIRGIPGFSSGNAKYYALVEFAPYDWRLLLRDGILGGVVSYHTEPDWNDIRGTPQQIFDARFVHVTAENFSEVSDRLPPFH